MNGSLNEEVWPSNESDDEEYFEVESTVHHFLFNSILYFLLCRNSFIMCQNLLFFACCGS